MPSSIKCAMKSVNWSKPWSISIRLRPPHRDPKIWAAVFSILTVKYAPLEWEKQQVPLCKVSPLAGNSILRLTWRLWDKCQLWLSFMPSPGNEAPETFLEVQCTPVVNSNHPQCWARDCNIFRTCFNSLKRFAWDGRVVSLAYSKVTPMLLLFQLRLINKQSHI